MPAERQQLLALTVGQPAEVADAGKSFGQDMLEETAQELFRGEGHGTLFAAMRVVLPTEGDRTVCNSEQSMVGDCYAMGVTGQVMEDMFGAAKGGLA